MYSDEFKQICEMIHIGDETNIELAYTLLSSLSLEERAVFIKSLIGVIPNKNIWLCQELLSKLINPNNTLSENLRERLYNHFKIDYNVFRYVINPLNPIMCGLEKTLHKVAINGDNELYDFSNFKKLEDVHLYKSFSKTIYNIPNIKYLCFDINVLNDDNHKHIELEELTIYFKANRNPSLNNKKLENFVCNTLEFQGNYNDDGYGCTELDFDKLNINCNTLYLHTIGGILDLKNIINEKRNDYTIITTNNNLFLKNNEQFIDEGGVIKWHNIYNDKFYIYQDGFWIEL